MQPSVGQFGSVLSSLLQSAGSSASPTASPVSTSSTSSASQQCPISPSQTTLNFSNIAGSCPSSGTAGSAFCAPCICALTEAYMPALVAAGLLPLTSTASASNFSLAKATDVITACTTSYLASALAANIDITGLSLLSTACNFTASNVPTCLVNLIFNKTANSTVLVGLPPSPFTPSVSASDLTSAPPASGDYLNDTNLIGQVTSAAANATSVPGQIVLGTNPAPISSAQTPSSSSSFTTTPSSAANKQPGATSISTPPASSLATSPSSAPSASTAVVPNPTTTGTIVSSPSAGSMVTTPRTSTPAADPTSPVIISNPSLTPSVESTPSPHNGAGQSIQQGSSAMVLTTVAAVFLLLQLFV
ncbi:hypothetical protein CEUSTIGMA_g1759.t1 [Chlamydomonas eustigma]|uniref:Uncharacterized protein n=1 Tax=Chlamydomonas eustigma TaxID=1157962 RepID=A0A250WUT7_9CHLO|nr:hypothetical protein CEUSTIGMA_g1759.t1 [Chlamydomonas eustigma]|eukprot:GAX74310.1 hypothetical protein CEUSTIGMA_g1759.t1 [Chlamydomonas eustigma]